MVPKMMRAAGYERHTCPACHHGEHIRFAEMAVAAQARRVFTKSDRNRYPTAMRRRSSAVLRECAGRRRRAARVMPRARFAEYMPPILASGKA